MATDGILLNGGEVHLLLGVFRGDVGMARPVALAGGVPILGVVKEIVVEKGAAHQLLPMEGKPGETGQPVAVIGHGQAVQQPGGGAVLNVLVDSL